MKFLRFWIKDRAHADDRDPDGDVGCRTEPEGGTRENQEPNAEGGDLERRRAAAEATLARRLHSLVPLDQERYADEALISQFAASAEMPGIESIVLTSGDAHFVPAVEEAQRRHGTKVVLFGYDVNVSAQLKGVVDEFWPFEAHEPTLVRAQRHRPVPGQRRL